ncbi:MAG: C10 family peptidase [Duncaniella sp.]|nr:C10 family peptidase [Duncaniella sp.]
MKKTFIMLAAAAMAAGGAEARTLSPAEALGRALSSADAPASVASMRAPNRVEAALTLSAETTDAPTLYVISRGEGKGFVAVAADDVAAPLLGYSDEGNASELNPNVRYWLSELSREIAAAIENGANPFETYKAPEAWDAISPKCTTQWNQDAPYNNLAPSVSGYKCPIGCVATAMAQVINYYKYPVQGVGAHSYNWNGQELSFDYANTTFDWANMADTYNSNSTLAQRNAVATLMYACAVSVDMGFRAEASGAYSFNVPAALRDYFNFDKGVYYAMRLAYSQQEWESMVYNEIKNNGPIYYAGRGESGGHAFVCDGYKDGMFHFNWGWGGMSDGYYRLHALVPGSQGIGGNSDGFNTDQSIILGLQKPTAENKLPAPYLYANRAISVSKSATSVKITGPFYNFSPYQITGKFGLELYDASGNVVKILPGNTANLQPRSGLSEFNVSFIQMPQGNYKGRLVYIDTDGVATPVHTQGWDTGYILMDREGTTVNIANIPNGALTVKDAEILSPFYSGKIFAVDIPYTFTGEQDMMIEVSVSLNDASGKTVANGEQLNAIIYPGDNKIEYVGKFLSNVPKGDYTLTFSTPFGSSTKILAGPLPITVGTVSGATITRINLNDWEIADADNANPEDFTVNAKISNIQGYYAGPVYVRIFEEGTTSNPLINVASENIFLGASESKQLAIKCQFLNAVPGKTYDVLIYSNTNSKLTSVAKKVKFSEMSGIEDNVITDEAPAEYFNLQGQPVAEPTPGSILIRRQGSKVEKVVVR